MKKKRSSSKKANIYGNMGRVLFFSLALVVGCCAVAVVLFETQVGLQLVAKVRGDGNSQSGNVKEPKPTSSSDERTNQERNFARESSESGNEQSANQDQNSVPDGDKGTGLGKDTSSKVANHVYAEQRERTEKDKLGSENIARNENTVEENVGKEKLIRESAAQTLNEEGNSANESVKREDEPADDVVRGNEEDDDEKEALEYIEEKLNEEGNVESPVGGDDETNGAQEQVNEESREDERESDNAENTPEEEESEPLEETMSEIGGEEQETESHDSAQLENLVEEVDDVTGDQKEEDMVSVGDSLADLEEQRKEENEESIKKEESSEQILEPEGPPIDEYPRNARRGLRGDYGGKECKDSHANCKGWASIGECTKNPIWMEVNCKKSCDVCGCSDNDVKCDQWSRAGECNKNSEFMNRNCMKSCGQC